MSEERIKKLERRVDGLERRITTLENRVGEVWLLAEQCKKRLDKLEPIVHAKR